MIVDNQLITLKKDSSTLLSNWLDLIAQVYSFTESDERHRHNEIATILLGCNRLLNASQILLTDTPNGVIKSHRYSEIIVSAPLVTENQTLYLIALATPFVDFSSTQRQYFALFAHAFLLASSLRRQCDELTFETLKLQQTLNRFRRFGSLMSPCHANMNAIENRSEHHQLSAVLAKSFHLSKSESRLALLVSEGIALKQISALLNRSENTLRSQLKAIYRKTQRHSQFSLSRLISTKRQQLHLAQVVYAVAGQLNTPNNLSHDSLQRDSGTSQRIATISPFVDCKDIGRDAHVY